MTAETTRIVIEEQWTYIPGEGQFKMLLDTDGRARGSVQLREGLFILGARNASNRRLISFGKSNFETEEEAVIYFNYWVNANLLVRTTD
jgi:hypothetical protein